jgi:dolichol-phosphate mannosyltransferase
MDAANQSSPTADLGLSLVVPAFNEAAVVRRVVWEADEVLSRLFARYEVVVVDDGSADGTADRVAELAAHLPHVRLVRHPANRGYGAALRTGFEAARHDLVAFTDADGQFDLTDLGWMAPLAGRVAVVAGYRADRQDPWRRRFLSKGYNLLARVLLGTRVRDVDCALKVFRREALDALLPESRGFFVNTEMLTRARQLGLAIADVPVTHRPRQGGESKVSLREVPRTLRTLLGFWWREVVCRPARAADPLPAAEFALVAERVTVSGRRVPGRAEWRLPAS